MKNRVWGSITSFWLSHELQQLRFHDATMAYEQQSDPARNPYRLAFQAGLTGDCDNAKALQLRIVNHGGTPKWGLFNRHFFEALVRY